MLIQWTKKRFNALKRDHGKEPCDQKGPKTYKNKTNPSDKALC